MKRAEGATLSPQEVEVAEGKKRANQPVGKSGVFRYGSDAADAFWMDWEAKVEMGRLMTLKI